MKSVHKDSTRHTPTVHVSFVSGSTGAVPAMSSASMRRSTGITGITRLSAGKYQVFLSRGANDLCRFTGHTVQASFALSGACQYILTATDLAAASPSFTFQITTAPGVAVDPSSGDVVNFSFEPKYSTGLA
jgi:hypothetical protein